METFSDLATFWTLYFIYEKISSCDSFFASADLQWYHILLLLGKILS